jgi:hypothetical protein
MSIRHHPSIEWKAVEIYRRSTPQQRVRAAFDLLRAIQRAQANSIRARHPHADLARELRRRLMGSEQFKRLEKYRLDVGRPQMSLMTKHERVVEQVVATLERLKIPYMIVGGVMASFWGRSRTTRDADIVVELSCPKAQTLVHSLGPAFFVEPHELESALRDRTFFVILHRQSGFSLHLLLRKDDPFHRAEFRRRKRDILFSRPAYLNSPEDTILSKLLWYRQTSQERDYRDALEIYEIQESTLEVKYLEHWAKQLKLMRLLAKIRREAARQPETSD